MRFIGVDLAWSNRNPSGVAVVRGDQHGLWSEWTESITGVEEIAVRLQPLQGDWMMAIDAPLVVPNWDGTRPCDRELSRRYGRYHAGCHPANRRKLGAVAPAEQLVRRLAGTGVERLHQPSGRRRISGRWAFEVYPHPAMIELFRLDRIVKYKRGRVGERRAGLTRLSQLLRQCLPRLDPPLRSNAASEALFGTDPADLRGRALKRFEDCLDAVFCAYLAAHCWAWGSERNFAIGDGSHGSITLPSGRRESTERA